MISSNRSLTLVPALAFVLGSFAATPPSFNPESYLKHIKFLAGDELKGRGNGTPELDKAADYIAGEFKSAGIQPAGDGGGYFQKFLVATGSRLGPGNKLTMQLGTAQTTAAALKDFLPFGVGEKTSVSGGIVFAGYGITAKEHGYDDYKGLDANDKIVLVMAHEPRENDPGSPFNGKELTIHGQDNSKVANAKFHNARAIFIVQDPVNHEESAREMPETGPVVEIDYLGIPALRITRAVAQNLLGPARKSLPDLQKQIDSAMAPQSFIVQDAQAQVDMDVTLIKKEVRNVVGLLPGTEAALAEEAVILGAHYDHLGLGGRSSRSPQLIGQIHHGADDNASGTAGLIELASALARSPQRGKRPYLFIAFAGEEIGLIGSDYWVKHPSKPLDKAIAMLNLDMIGRSKEGSVTVSGIGTSPMLPDLVRKSAEQLGLRLKTSQSGYGSSDQSKFYEKSVPVLFFFSGLHSDYHRPSDEWQTINAEGAVKILNMVLQIAEGLNAIDSRPQFTKVDDPTPGPARGGAPGYGTYFGSVPDMTDEVKGVRFSDVRPNSPAAKAGLIGQDIMIRFAGREIQNLQDFTYVLRTHKPGDVVEVVVLRGGQELKVSVTLEIRR